MMIAVWKFAQALAAGNTIVLKPSDTTPASTVYMAELFVDILPRGCSTSSAETATPGSRWSVTRFRR
jgi:acyl-CoA reductase-like NAD-dependent aldehyde dehydrogenase